MISTLDKDAVYRAGVRLEHTARWHSPPDEIAHHWRHHHGSIRTTRLLALPYAVVNCTGGYNGGGGITAGEDSGVTACAATGNGGSGAGLDVQCTVTRCSGAQNAGHPPYHGGVLARVTCISTILRMARHPASCAGVSVVC